MTLYLTSWSAEEFELARIWILKYSTLHSFENVKPDIAKIRIIKIEEIAKVLNVKVYKLFEENDNTHKTLPKRVDMKHSTHI